MSATSASRIFSSFGDTIFSWLQFVTDSFVTLVLGTLVLFLIFLVQGRNGEKDIETIKIFICIYIINFIYIIIYIKYYISTLHFWKQLKVPKYQVPKYYSCCFCPPAGKSIRLGLMTRHARPDDPSGSAWSGWGEFRCILLHENRGEKWWFFDVLFAKVPKSLYLCNTFEDVMRVNNEE